MRIGIDARFYGTETGIGRYLERLIAELEVLDREREYVIFLRKENAARFKPKNPRFKKVIADIRWYTLREQALLPHILARERLDLAHFPHFNVPLFYRQPFVVTIHDLILLQHPSRRATTLAPLLYSAKYWGYRMAIGSAVRRAKRVLTVSEFSRREICHTFGLSEDRVSVAPLAPGVRLGAERPANSGVSPYILFVGNSYPHKNLERLIQAFVLLTKKTGGRYELVLAGPEDFFQKRLRQEVNGIGSVATRVRFTGAVDDNKLAALYQNASLFVIPSLTEGFGIPPLEAMAAGVPVAAAQAGSLPEVLGDAALYFNPYNIEEMAAAMLRGLTDRGVRDNLIARGREQSAKYSWRTCAERTLATYEEALKNDSTKNKK